ncbi:hypothetical protein GOV10_07005, partial [Candidatus Woesearchaeota archaeon]|nr:hypothetical protein [Candidatus Woesearchaeota archaeon]
KMDNLFFSLEQLEEEKVDVFDLRLELKLALDKVKAGNFNMVDVYLEGLTPRIEKQWDKLGKKPKQFERELIDMKDLEEELAKAKQERDKYVAEKSEGEEKKVEDKKEVGWKDDVAPDKMLNLVNGMIVISLTSLYDEVTAMKDEDFEKHVVEGEKNDFAEWVMNAVGDTKLAYNLYSTSDKAKMVEILEIKRDEKELPDAKPPAWLGKAVAAGADKKEADKKEDSTDKKDDEKKEEGDETKSEEGENKEPETKEGEEKEGEETPTEQPPTETPENPQEQPSQPEQHAEPPSEQPPAEAQTAEQQPVTVAEQASEQPTEQQTVEEQPTGQPSEQQPTKAQATEAKATPQTEAPPAQEVTPVSVPLTVDAQEAAVDEFSKEPEEKTVQTYDDLIASPDKAFKFDDGSSITSVKELREILMNIPEDQY